MGGHQTKSVHDHTLTLSDTELQSYFTGTWFEQVRSDVRFERGCINAFQYFVQDDGNIEAVNKCTNVDKSIREARLTLEHRTSEKASFRMRYKEVSSGYYNIVYYSDGIAIVAGNSWAKVWVLTREKHPEKASVCAAMATLSNTPLRKQTLLYNDGKECRFADSAPRQIVKVHHISGIKKSSIIKSAIQRRRNNGPSVRVVFE